MMLFSLHAVQSSTVSDNIEWVARQDLISSSYSQLSGQG
jgi:hypothetical protein